MHCKGVCTRHKAPKPTNHIQRYVIGQKRCQVCDIFIWWDGAWCPCCGCRLRTKPRSLKYKTMYREAMQAARMEAIPA